MSIKRQITLFKNWIYLKKLKFKDFLNKKEPCPRCKFNMKNSKIYIIPELNIKYKKCKNCGLTIDF
jgi:transcription elongation factor Elf1